MIKNFIIAILIILLIVCFVRILALTPTSNLIGTYQSTENLPDFYTFSCDLNEYKLHKRDVLISEGKVENIKEKLYLCTNEKESFIITLGKEKFYLYLDEKPLEFTRRSKFPSTIVKE